MFERRSRIRKENADFEQTPLESWYSLCEQLIRSQVKREDSSMVLIDLMSRYSAESAKYASIYSYIKELMEGKYTSKLSAHDSIVFLCLIDSLSSFIKSQNLTALKDHILRHYQQLNEQLASGEHAKRSQDEEGAGYLNYFQQIDPAKLRDDIRLASAQLNRSARPDQQVAEQQFGEPRRAIPSEQAGNPAANQRNQCRHPTEQVSAPPRQKREQTRTLCSTTNNKTPAIPPSSQASAVSFAVSSSVSATTDDESATSNLANQHSSFNKQAQFADLISECSSARSNLTDPDGTQQPATSRPDQSLLKSQNPLYQYSQLPRIAKIRECLNPLGISIEVLRDLHSALAAKNATV